MVRVYCTLNGTLNGTLYIERYIVHCTLNIERYIEWYISWNANWSTHYVTLYFAYTKYITIDYTEPCIANLWFNNIKSELNSTIDGTMRMLAATLSIANICNVKIH